MRVSVVGGSRVDPETTAVAEALGTTLAERGHTVICGGLGGVMTAVCRGAKRVDGDTVGVLPTDDPADANEFVDTPIATGMGHGRNAIVAMNGDAMIAVNGGYGTLSEIAIGCVYGLPVAGLDTHDVDGVEPVETPAEAVDYVEAAVDGDHGVGD